VSDSQTPRENPFATKFIRPGAIPFLFPEGVTAESLVDRLRAADWSGQIVGPHGGGKTTLLRALAPEIQRRRRQLIWTALHDGQRKLPADVLRTVGTGAVRQLIVDGYEQLSRWQRWRLRRHCTRLRSGLLVTAHTDAGLPTIYHVHPGLGDFQQIARLLAAPSGWKVSDEQLADVYTRHAGNIREGLFALYDLYQQHNGTAAGTIVSGSECDND
jgi:hypothetical protein